jgi:hypothetical protein
MLPGDGAQARRLDRVQPGALTGAMRGLEFGEIDDRTWRDHLSATGRVQDERVKDHAGELSLLTNS